MSTPFPHAGEVCRNRHDSRVLHADIELADGTMIRRDVVFRDLPATERVNSGRISACSKACFDGGLNGLAAWAAKRRATLTLRKGDEACWSVAERVPA